MADVVLRPAVSTDAEQLAPLHLQVWNEAYAGLMPADVLAERSASPIGPRVEVWRRRIEANTVVVAVGDDERIVGWAETGPGRDPDRHEQELMSIYVVAACYGTGVGHRLLEATVGDSPVYLWVLEGNERAIRFYERHGFAFDGATKADPPYGTEARMLRP